MPTTVFYSWQSDTPRSVNHDFIRSVLDEVCAELNEDTEVAEALRDLSVDSDTQGVAGQPPIVDTILKKIDSAAVVVADVTFTGSRAGGRLTPNPNVLIEYGWALKSRGHERVICLMNETYGSASATTLPFDMAHLRWPVRYNLPDGASKTERSTVAKALKPRIAQALKLALGNQARTQTTAQAFQPREGYGPRFAPAGVTIGIDEEFFGQKDVVVSAGSEAWLRVMPSLDSGSEWASHELKKQVTDGGLDAVMPLFRYGSGWGFLRSEHGFGLYRGTRSDSGDHCGARRDVRIRNRRGVVYRK